MKMMAINARTGRMTAAAVSPADRPPLDSFSSDDDDGSEPEPEPEPDPDGFPDPDPEPELVGPAPPPVVVGTTASVVTPDAEESLGALVWPVVGVGPAFEAAPEAPLVGDGVAAAPDTVVLFDLYVLALDDPSSVLVLCPESVCVEVVKGCCDDDGVTGTSPNDVVDSAAGGNSPPFAAVAMLKISLATLFNGCSGSTAISRGRSGTACTASWIKENSTRTSSRCIVCHLF
jgi:hypothetical protein